MHATTDADTWYDVRVIADDEDVTVHRAERDNSTWTTSDTLPASQAVHGAMVP